MALLDADLKLLWSRAAGLCSFPDCKEILVRFSKAESGMYQIGEMAHLVARSIKGPRGKGQMALDARDSYENHVLLCPTCHTEIDKNPGDYPIEKLEAFKNQHEHWVAETLVENLGKKAGFQKFYGDLLSRLERLLEIDHFPWLIDHLWRDLAPSSVIESVVEIRSMMLKTIWPGTKPKFEQAFKSVLQAWNNYCKNFESACQYRQLHPNFMVSAHVQPGMSGAERISADDKQQQWSKKNGELLFAFVVTLNVLVDVVRAELLPTYRQDEGYFLIHDDLGYRNGGESIIIRPTTADLKRKSR